ncbi:LysR family transcriptional regulator [uncultured Adlercreutzia sp.]|uniref:LysR family transcriptional regulator n=1 Tax=uncultured Adlercreutzia sp. TaxID=875803 RepID=UPI0026F3F698|nr:LysR family transcriptional regulator [uncultured Adlercreutzia sp.]
MELAYYQEFIELSKQLNFRKTAESLCLSQSALSKHLKALEDHYGSTLLARSRQGVSLTPEGAELLEYAQVIWRDYQQSKEAMDRLRETRPLVVGGLLESPEEHPVVAELIRHMAERPGMRRLRIRNVGSAMPSERLHGLESNLFDCYVFYGLDHESKRLADGPEVAIAPICDVPLDIVVSADSVLADKESVTLSDLAGGTFIHLSGPNFTPTWRLVETILQEKGVPYIEKPVPTDSVYDYANLDLGNAILAMPRRRRSSGLALGARTRTIHVSDPAFKITLEAAYLSADEDESMDWLVEGLRRCYGDVEGTAASEAAN